MAWLQLPETSRNGRRTRHPELHLFRNWGEAEDHAENGPTRADLLPW
ncbi:hypothetical protein [Streptomyces sp. NPDC001635]